MFAEHRSCADVEPTDARRFRGGVVVVPFERLDEVIRKLVTIAELQTALDAKVADGMKVPDWVVSYLDSDQTVIKN